MNKPLNLAIKYAAAQLAPTLDNPQPFLAWANDTAELLAHIYSTDFNTVLTNLVDACRVVQDYED